MQPLPHFELLRPANLDQALTQLALPGARALGGGTDLLPNLRRGLEQPSPLIDLGDLPGFADIDDGEPPPCWLLAIRAERFELGCAVCR